MIAVFCNGEPIDALSLDSRAAHYGDGAFTTMRVHAGRVVFWPAHRQRLRDACGALHLSEPEWSDLEALLARECVTHAASVFKLALVPRAGARGYVRAWPSVSDVYLFVHGLPAIDPSVYREGLQLEARRVDFPSTHDAGIKSLSRLDQVLIAPAVSGRDLLACDRDGFLLGGQSANVFALFGSTWVTPPSGRGVISGVMRSMLLQSPPPGFSARVQAMHRDALNHADALILCNAVRGIMPVRCLGDRRYLRREGVVALMHAFHPELGLPDA